jgi:hypothetical protein
MKWRGAVGIASCRSRTAWACGRGDVFSLVRDCLSGNWIGGGPPWLVEDLVDEVLYTRVAGRHADVESVKGGNEFVDVRERWMGWGQPVHGVFL